MTLTDFKLKKKEKKKREQSLLLPNGTKCPFCSSWFNVEVKMAGNQSSKHSYWLVAKCSQPPRTLLQSLLTSAINNIPRF